VSSRPTASIVIPTRNRPGYLRDALASITPQAQRAGAEVIVVDNGEGTDAAAVAREQGAHLIAGPRPGANAARNAGIAASRAELIVFCDDDVRAPDGWLQALLEGVALHPDHDVFGGPIRAELENGGPRECGREPVPITTLDLGAEDRDANLVWSANMAIRRLALERVGGFDETIQGRGEEEDWELRYTAQGGRIRYLARAGLVHRRCGGDARLPALARAAYGLGRSARRYDRR
jgi:GT2 family glycosyltransferase